MDRELETRIMCWLGGKEKAHGYRISLVKKQRKNRRKKKGGKAVQYIWFLSVESAFYNRKRYIHTLMFKNKLLP